MKKLTLSTVTLLTAVTLAGCSTSENVVTSAGNQTITKDEFYEAMKDSVGETTLQRMILINIFENEAGTNEFAKEADAEVTESMASVGGEEAFKGFIQEMGFASIEDYKQQILLNKLLPEAIKNRTEITDEDLAAAYESYEPQINAAHILVDDEDVAKDLIKQINEGADFAELAKENSTDGSAENGGDLGFFGKGQMVPEFEEVAYTLDEGEVTDTPVESEYGYHIIKMLEKPEKGTLEEETEQLKDIIIQEKIQDAAFFNGKLAEIVKDADVKVNDSDFKDIMAPFLVEEEAVEAQDSATTETEESATTESTPETEESAE
ncbi:peptidylprolyl isomerase [Jeotgalibaca sp. MA1X17-3]|uniref:peptidylprolyl isomerase n=1 Tax=Jeotgalibaca sp. MA1X17-3 TaxID=2908211 RepID=UPI001F3006C7|nr:peptidylprolyl isomerase [Jeotgalibaca sp. MA1X17-3]UJF15191.1 peptidylprolyl isomerase [Jeotgalibaca sp. MA1X17-3]